MAAPTQVVSIAADFAHSDCRLEREGFPRILWIVLGAVGYPTPPQYLGREYVERGVPRCRVHLVVAPHPLHLEWQPLELEVFGYRLADTRESAAQRALTTFCAPWVDDPDWLLRFQSSQALVAAMPTESAYTFVRCMKAYARLQGLLGEALPGMAERMAESSHTTKTDKDAQIADLERQLAELQVARDAGVDREALLEAQLEDAQWELGHANEMLALADAQFAQMQGQNGGGNGEDEDPEEAEDVSEMDTEENIPSPDRPPSPAGSEASVNNLDDY
ncbi:hypothetical protein PVAP13_7NG044689 [Panicum virgatum]|uniref:Uncharacterized protein n=1 Tax=Panicum virgatum TaxID=38727 RepID=A0A8T0PUH7_PANVG|nr:hypothetical protein PVAP13_7NG044689 [Panicum virgatum]